MFDQTVFHKGMANLPFWRYLLYILKKAINFHVNTGYRHFLFGQLYNSLQNYVGFAPVFCQGTVGS